MDTNTNKTPSSQNHGPTLITTTTGTRPPLNRMWFPDPKFEPENKSKEESTAKAAKKRAQSLIVRVERMNSSAYHLSSTEMAILGGSHLYGMETSGATEGYQNDVRCSKLVHGSKF